MKVVQSCPAICDPMDQARMLDWVAFPFIHGIVPNPGIEPRSPSLLADSLAAEPPGNYLLLLLCKLNEIVYVVSQVLVNGTQ